MRLIVKSAIQTSGRDRYVADCPLSRALRASKIKKGMRENPYILPQDVKAFVNEGFTIEYSGFRNETLDRLGAKKIDE